MRLKHFRRRRKVQKRVPTPHFDRALEAVSPAVVREFYREDVLDPAITLAPVCQHGQTAPCLRCGDEELKEHAREADRKAYGVIFDVPVGMAVPRERIELQFVPGSLTPEQVLEHFYAGLSANSKKAYSEDMAALAAWYRGLEVPELVKVLLGLSQAEANAMAAAWLESMQERGLSTATRARRLVTLRSFGRAARAAGLVTWTIELRGPKVQHYRDTRGVPEDGVHKMFASCGDGLEGKRNRLILFLLAVLGLRRHEVARLNTSDVGFDLKRLHIVGKGGVEKWLHVPQPVYRALREWEAERTTMQMLKKIKHWTEDQNVPLICSLAEQNYGGRLTGAGVNHIVHAIAERAGVKGSSNSLRHSMVTTALDRNHPIEKIRALSRHKNLETVLIYDDNREDRQQRDAGVSDDLAETYEKGKP